MLQVEFCYLNRRAARGVVASCDSWVVIFPVFCVFTTVCDLRHSWQNHKQLRTGYPFENNVLYITCFNKSYDFIGVFNRSSSTLVFRSLMFPNIHFCTVQFQRADFWIWLGCYKTLLISFFTPLILDSRPQIWLQNNLAYKGFHWLQCFHAVNKVTMPESWHKAFGSEILCCLLSCQTSTQKKLSQSNSSEKVSLVHWFSNPALNWNTCHADQGQ